ncbi:hypothetical protein P7C70_g3598, partial [Phenoliferia sp. Uapishka_3]
MSRVIVVGGGLSGLSAAHTLYERGANVLLLDKNSFMGGNSTKATSGINGAGTAAQSALGIPDTPKAFFDDTKKSARELARDDLIKVLTGKSGDAVNWLMDRFNLDLSKVSRLGGHSFERTHRGGAQVRVSGYLHRISPAYTTSAQFPGMTITYAQMEALEDLAEAEPGRVTVLKKAAATSLIKDGDTVVGVNYTYNGENLQELGPVILATGGYAADFSKDGLLNKYRPDLMHLPTTNGDHWSVNVGLKFEAVKSLTFFDSISTGDGQKMVIDIGGKGIDLDKVQVHPTGLVDPKDPDAKVKFLAAEALRGVGGLLLDGEGNRFADELGHRDYVTGRIWENNKYPVRLILNGEASKEIEWHCKHYCGRGLMKRFETGAELAKEMGLPEKKLEQVFADYVKVCKNPKLDPFGKKFFSNTDWSMNSGPFNVAIMTPVLHYTMGGLEIDEHSAVIDTAGKPIPGLFASGEIAGGVHGANRLGGSSLLGCVVFGRVAGDSAASYLLSTLTSPSAVATSRLNQVGGHLGMATTIRIDPTTKKVHLEFAWDDNGIASSTASDVKPPPKQIASAVQAKEEKKQEAPKEQREITLEEVAKHNKDDDVWVVVNGVVLDCTPFLSERTLLLEPRVNYTALEARATGLDPRNLAEDVPWVVIKGIVYDVSEFMDGHPGGPGPIMMNLGKDITSLFTLLHPKGTLEVAAPSLRVLGKLSPTVKLQEATTGEAEAAERRLAAPPIGAINTLLAFAPLARDVLGVESEIWNYYSGWADSGASLDGNASSFSFVRFIPRIAAQISPVHTTTTFFSTPVSLPIFLSPTAQMRGGHPLGELNHTRAAAHCNVVQGLSNVASVSIPEIGDEKARLEQEDGISAPLWWQLYLKTDRKVSEEHINQAVKAGATAILFTMDTPVFGKRVNGHISKVSRLLPKFGAPFDQTKTNLPFFIKD